ncbi:MAG: type II toxin-antitoxin system HicA family toxin [Candidatus Paceibacterota bacterium]|jgi:predicted RNA binding protein YcfA (HicA-like mRNA interferase family)
MGSLKPIHWKKFEKFLFSVGCHFERERGDHRVYWKEGLNRPIVIPRSEELPIFIIRNNLRILNIDSKKYLEILEKI